MAIDAAWPNRRDVPFSEKFGDRGTSRPGHALFWCFDSGPQTNVCDVNDTSFASL